MTSETKLPMTRSWNEIEARYRESVDAGVPVTGMLRLVEQIKVSTHARALHPWTSMHDLCIVQVPGDYPYDGPHLRISPRFDGTIEFRYIDTHVASRQWHRVVKEEDAFRRLERFMDQLHWVGREKKRDPAS
jgi:hypothetical protein